MVQTALILSLVAPAVVAAPVPKDFKKAVKLDGKWKVTAYWSSGREITTSSILNQTWEIAGEKLTITRSTAAKSSLRPTTIKLRTDAKTKPMELDYTLASGSTRVGVFQIDGDTLTVCLRISTTVRDRPKTLDAGTGILKYTLKRVGK